VLTPHSAFYSIEGEQELRRKAAQNLATWLATGRPEYVVVVDADDASTTGPSAGFSIPVEIPWHVLADLGGDADPRRRLEHRTRTQARTHHPIPRRHHPNHRTTHHPSRLNPKETSCWY
jgi:hypothetical protein